MKQELGKKINLILVWCVRITIIITMGIMFFQQQYYPIKILGITFVLTFYAYIIKKITKVEVPYGIQIALTSFIFAAQYLGTVMDWYGMFYWWDTLLHTISGILFFRIGILILGQINQKTEKVKLNPIIIILFGICFSLSIGVVWELIEFIADSFFGANMQRAIGEVGRNAILDTMTDLSVATLGTMLGAIMYAFGTIKKVKFICKTNV